MHAVLAIGDLVGNCVVHAGGLLRDYVAHSTTSISGVVMHAAGSIGDCSAIGDSVGSVGGFDRQLCWFVAGEIKDLIGAAGSIARVARQTPHCMRNATMGS